jgi:hypothetical protein
MLFNGMKISGILKEILMQNLLKFSKDLLMTPINNLGISLLITV